MQRPKNITEWIEERICFLETTLFHIKDISDENKSMISEFTLALENYKYCKILHTELLKDNKNTDLKKRFKNISHLLLFGEAYELDRQEYKCIQIHGISFPTSEKDTSLPQYYIDNTKKIRDSFEVIFSQINELLTKE